MGTRFGTWKIKILQRANSIATVSKELSKYKLDLVGAQEVRWESWEKSSFRS
jgi:hypothetical protein